MSSREIPVSSSGQLEQADLGSRGWLGFQAVGGLLALLGVVAIDLFVLEAPFADGRPILSGVYLLRTCLIAAGCGLLVNALAKFGIRRSTLPRPGAADWERWGIVSWRLKDSSSPSWSMNVIEAIPWATLFAAALMVLVFAGAPWTFSQVSFEDRPVEIMSAALHFATCVLFVLVAIQLFRGERPGRVLGIWASAALAIVFALIGLEEVSWFQRQLGVETPELFSANLQNEMNLHNFATDEIENIYYFSMFVLLILVPFVFHFVWQPSKDFFQILSPSVPVIYVSAMIMAFNYDMWNIALTQVAFFTTLFVVLHLLRVARRNGRDGRLEIGLLAGLVISQAAFIALGHRLIREWDLTEYKELLIPLACAFYAGDVLHRVWIEKRSREASYDLSSA